MTQNQSNLPGKQQVAGQEDQSKSGQKQGEQKPTQDQSGHKPDQQHQDKK